MNNLKHYYFRAILRITHFFSDLLPPTKGFGVRRFLYRQAGLKISDNVRIVGGAKFHYHNISIGADSWIGTETQFFTSASAMITVGKCVDIAPGCLINTGTHEIGNRSRRAGRNVAHSINIGDGTWIGLGVIILDGTEIGQGCIVAAGAVVRGDFPDNVMIGGVPARVLKSLPNS